MADIPKSLRIDPFACTPSGLRDNFTSIVREFVENGSKVVRFRLTANLSTGEDAAAVILTANGNTYVEGDVIQVFDHYEQTTQAPGNTRGQFTGITGQEGFAKLRETSVTTGRIEGDIIEMEHWADKIEFTLTSTFTAGVASATVSASWHGNAPTSPLNVHDDLDNYSWAQIGDKGVASRSEYATETTPATPYYKVIELLPDADGGDPFANGGLVFYVLTADLEAGGSATATVIAGDAPVSTAITVVDRQGATHRGMWEAPSGTTGWAKRRSTLTGNYDIIWQSPHAWHIEFTLETDMTANGEGEYTADALVTRSYEQGIDPGANVTVRDRKGIFPQAKAGAHGHARREEYYNGTAAAPEYEVIQCQQVALTGRALLTEKMCEAGEFGITDFVPMSMSPFNQNITPTTAFNDLGHKGRINDIVILAWDEALDAYVIIDVSKEEISVGLTSWDDSAKCIVTTRYEIAAETCEDVEGGTVICFAPCDQA